MPRSLPTRAACPQAAAFQIALAAALAVGGFVGAASAATTTANLTINAAQTVRVVDNRVFGLNTAEWNQYNTAYGDPQVQALFQATNTGALRYPGGSTADAYHWQNDSTEGSKLVAGSRSPIRRRFFLTRPAPTSTSSRPLRSS